MAFKLAVDIGHPRSDCKVLFMDDTPQEGSEKYVVPAMISWLRLQTTMVFTSLTANVIQYLITY